MKLHSNLRLDHSWNVSQTRDVTLTDNFNDNNFNDTIATLNTQHVIHKYEYNVCSQTAVC